MDLEYFPGTQPLELSKGSLEFEAGHHLTENWWTAPAPDCEKVCKMMK